MRVAAIHQFYHSLPMDVSACYHCMVYEYIGAHVFYETCYCLVDNGLVLCCGTEV